MKIFIVRRTDGTLVRAFKDERRLRATHDKVVLSTLVDELELDESDFVPEHDKPTHVLVSASIEATITLSQKLHSKAVVGRMFQEAIKRAMAGAAATCTIIVRSTKLVDDDGNEVANGG